MTRRSLFSLVAAALAGAKAKIVRRTVVAELADYKSYVSVSQISGSASYRFHWGAVSLGGVTAPPYSYRTIQGSVYLDNFCPEWNPRETEEIDLADWPLPKPRQWRARWISGTGCTLSSPRAGGCAAELLCALSAIAYRASTTARTTSARSAN